MSQPKFPFNSIVTDQYGTLGILLDYDNADTLDHGVLYVDVDPDGGLYWSLGSILTLASESDAILFRKWLADYQSKRDYTHADLKTLRQRYFDNRFEN